MPLFSGRRKAEDAEAFDPNPGVIDRMPARPYRVLYADLPLCSDPECKSKIEEASIVIPQSEDPKQQHQVRECMPTRKKYKAGELVNWELNNKKSWQNCWYVNPETGAAERAWVQAVEFTGKIVAVS
jgi:hypothetical protein